jgi:hypothetical protein
MLDAHVRVEWISAGDQQFRALEEKRNLEEKTIMQLNDMDPWEFEVVPLFINARIWPPFVFLV